MEQAVKPAENASICSMEEMAGHLWYSPKTATNLSRKSSRFHSLKMDSISACMGVDAMCVFVCVCVGRGVGVSFFLVFFSFLSFSFFFFFLFRFWSCRVNIKQLIHDTRFIEIAHGIV